MSSHTAFWNSFTIDIDTIDDFFVKFTQKPSAKADGFVDHYYFSQLTCNAYPGVTQLCYGTTVTMTEASKSLPSLRRTETVAVPALTAVRSPFASTFTTLGLLAEYSYL